MAATSEPASGSLSAKAAIFWPLATAFRYFACCAGVPASVMAPLPRPCIANAKSAKGEWKASVSRRITSERESSAGNAPPCAAGTQ
ncbi:hypothetical protein D9M70_647940 [compost metagenome]